MPKITQADNGTAVDVRIGETVVVELPENPTTGFRWDVDRIDGDVVTVARSDFAIHAARVGEGGLRTFELATTKTGTAGVHFKLWRDWEGDRSVAERFGVTLRVA